MGGGTVEVVETAAQRVPRHLGHGAGADTIDGGTVSNVRVYQNTPGPIIDPLHADPATITVDAGNPLGLTDGADLISATFADADVGFEVASQGL